eukprot:358045-Chlamydomonas_euryale.AAC.2
MCRGRSSMPVMPAKAQVGMRPRTCMSEAGGRPRARQAWWAETRGRDKHVLCKADAAKVSHEGAREDRPLMHTTWTGFTEYQMHA